MKKKIFLLFLVCFAFTSSLPAFNLKKIGLGNNGSVIYSIFQDNRGLIWLGTNTGLTTYDGKKTKVMNGFKGIKNIQGTPAGEIYAETLYGLKILPAESDSLSVFEMFNTISFSAVDSRSTSFVVQGNGFIYYKVISQDNYDNLILPDLISAKIKAFFIDQADRLQIITNEGIFRSFEIQYTHNAVHLKEISSLKRVQDVLFCFRYDTRIFMVDQSYILYEIDSDTQAVSYIDNLKPALSDKGEITSGIIFKNEIYLGTETGLYKIKNGKIEKVLLKTGITHLLKDKFQDLIWIGTAGDGVYTYSYDRYSMKSYPFSEFFPAVSKPVTAISSDNRGTVWIGTKGDGLILLPDYVPGEEISAVKTLSYTDGLPDNTIYSLSKSEYGIWIGCKSGLAFYSYKDKEIIKQNDILLQEVRAVYEQDSTLWLACYDKGIVRINIIYRNGNPEFHQAKRYSLPGGNVLNRFTSVYGDTTRLLFINAGDGIYRMTKDALEKFENMNNKFSSANRIAPMNQSDYFAVTDRGIFLFDFENKERLISPIATQDVLAGNSSDYWFTTDDGILLYTTDLDNLRHFDGTYGLAVTEYNTGATFKEEQTGTLFLGGMNGFTTIRSNDYDEAMDYMPVLYLEGLTLFGLIRDKNEFLKGKTDRLLFESNENFFSVTFNALDYINGKNYNYYYKIADGQWIDNGNSGTVSFTNVSPGTYHLSIKYYNKMLNKESYIQRLLITVLPPWYRSPYAYAVYFLFILTSLYVITYFVMKHKKKAREAEKVKIEQRRKEEIYEAKLDFFTDIAHEFCTPLTLISAPCNLILNQKNISPSVVKYADIIHRNAKRMNLLISDLMDFKQMESGYKVPEIVGLDISEVADHVIDFFKLNASGSVIQIKKQYPSDMAWNSDEKFLVTILINLLSNAVKYSEEESVQLKIDIENQKLTIRVISKGEGIAKEDIARLFDRFSVLPNKKQSGWKQNGLGLTITSKMVKLLSGNMEVESIPDETTTFVVTLPYLQTDAVKTTGKYDLNETTIPEFAHPHPRYEYREECLTVTVIDDDPEMLWLLCDILSDEFNVVPVKDSRSAIEILSINHTDIILCDIMMDDIDGIKLSKILKSDKSTSHIPLIIVSAVHDIEVQTEALNAGAELYVTKPFDTNYLKTTIRRLLGRKEDLKDYFTSPLSSYELHLGKLQHADHRKFLKKIYSIISKNVQNGKLSPDFIASELGMSLRTLYRQLKEVTDKGLSEIIRDGKLAVAENLLLKSTCTIDEIVFKSGFSSRASFYRAFSKKHNCTPSEFIEKNNLLP